jgi:hypothetical protein
MMGGQQSWCCLSACEILKMHHSTPGNKAVVQLITRSSQQKLTNFKFVHVLGLLLGYFSNTEEQGWKWLFVGR